MSTKEAIDEIERLADRQLAEKQRADAVMLEALRWLDEGAPGRAKQTLLEYLVWTYYPASTERLENAKT